MSRVYSQLLQELNYKNIEVVIHKYTRVFFQDSGLAKDLVDEINSKKGNINAKFDTEIDAYVMGKNNSLVMVEDLGSLLERSPDDFELIKRIILKYITDAPSGTAKEVLKIETSSRPQKGKKGSVVVRRKEEKSSPKPSETESESNDGAIGNLTFDTDIELWIAKYLNKEEIETCNTLIKHLTKQFGISEEDASRHIDVWAKKNEANGSLEYDPDYEDGEGMITTL